MLSINDFFKKKIFNLLSKSLILGSFFYFLTKSDGR